MPPHEILQESCGAFMSSQLFGIWLNDTITRGETSDKKTDIQSRRTSPTSIPPLPPQLPGGWQANRPRPPLHI